MTWANTFAFQYEAYSSLGVAKAAQTTESATKKAPAQQPAAAKNQAANEAISGAPKLEPEGQKVLSKEERIEYRDQDGNLLDEEQVKALEGKVEFKTKYETRTRVLDGAGNQVEVLVDDNAGDAGVAPPHPDVEGANQQTKKKNGEEPEVHKEASESKAGEKEAEKSSPKPASDGANEATV